MENLTVNDFKWRYYLRYVIDPNEKEKDISLKVKIGNA